MRRPAQADGPTPALARPRAPDAPDASLPVTDAPPPPPLRA
jgi:hypothetical protein